MRCWTSIKDIKDLLKATIHIPPSQQHIFETKAPKELPNKCRLHDMGIESSGSILRLLIDTRQDSTSSIVCSDELQLDDNSLQLVSEVKLGLERNRIPAKSDLLDGTSGVYFMRSASGAHLAVFKPRDEEQGMPNNPKDYAGIGDVGLRENFLPGEGCYREWAVYVMDVGGFSRVPCTTLVHCEHTCFNYPRNHGKSAAKIFPKFGSLQRFVRSEDSFENFGRNFFR